jgi:hypothetical protein
MKVIRRADLTMHLWQRYVTVALIPLGGSSVTVRREMSIFNNHVVVRIEGKANEIVQKATDGAFVMMFLVCLGERFLNVVFFAVIISWLSTVLAKQKKLDFKPKNDDLAFARINTEPCLTASEFLATRVGQAATVSLSGKNAEAFLTEVGVSFHACVFTKSERERERLTGVRLRLLLDHLKRFPVSATGGLMLTK